MRVQAAARVPALVQWNERASVAPPCQCAPDKGADDASTDFTRSTRSRYRTDRRRIPSTRTERPFLRAEFLYQPQAEGAAFTIGMAPGIALKLVGARIYNRCTGEILISKPPSTGFADRPAPGHQDPACARAGKAPEPDPSLAALDSRPDQLSKSDIGDAMTKIRPQLFDCYQKFHVPGALVLSYVVGGNGTVQSVQVGSTFAGTPTGTCTLEVAKDAHFPTFKRERQEFKYMFYLRHQ